MWASVFLPLLRVSLVPYDVARVTAEVGCALLATILNRRQQIAVRVTLLMVLIGAPAGVWGARLLDMIEYGSEYSSVSMALARNGSSIYGAFFASFLVVAILARLLRVPLLRMLDGAAPALALSEAITRLGCFCAGCCYGVPWDGPWAVTFPQSSFAFSDLRLRGVLGVTATQTVPLHPVQLYGTAIMLLVTIGLVWRFARRAHDGEVFALFLIAYGAERLLLAPFRMEVLASMKVFSVLFIVVGLLVLSVARHSALAKKLVIADERAVAQ
jgi:phosphatidylglycerol:prolipoprotein diacylglycerol transferase